MHISRRWATGLVAGAAALTLAGGAATASASVHPTPSDTETVNPQFGVPSQLPVRPRVIRVCQTIRTFTPTHPIVTPSDDLAPSQLPGDTASGEAPSHPTAEPTHTGPSHPIATVTPTVEPRVRVVRVFCRPEHFNVAEVLAGPNLSTELLNYAAATGPVNGTGRDDQVSNTLDRFTLGGDRVNVRHTGIPFPAVNLTNCTVSVNQLGLWSFNGGTGLNRHAIGQGTFHLALLAHFPNVRGVCSLRFLTRVNPLLQNRIGPDFLTVAVHGDGVAAR